MILSLRYGDLSGMVSSSNKLADELDQYCDELSRKVQQKMYSVEGGMSSALNSADYYVNQKVRELRTRESNARNLSAKTQALLDTAKRVDDDVARTIQDNQKTFFHKNPELKAPWYQQAWTSFMCDIKNIPVIGWLAKGGEQLAKAVDQLKKDIKYWWKCGGGKELVMNCVDIAIKIAGAVLAVITAVSAVLALAAAIVAGTVTLGLVIFAVAASITALITTVNALTNTFTSVQSIIASRNGAPAMAKIYADRDTLAQVLREENFHNRTLNRASNIAAIGIEITEAVAGIVLLVQSIGKIAGTFLSKNGVGFAFKELARGADGKLTTKVTLKSIWQGTKAMILNKKLTASTAKGLRTTLFNNIWESIRYQGTLFKMAMRDPVRWLRTKEIGDMGFFKNITENIRLGSWHLKNTAFQFRANDFKFNLDKVKNIVSAGKDILEGINEILDSLNRTDGKGWFRRKWESFSQDTFFDNDFFKLFNEIGLPRIVTDWDKSNTLNDFTGAKKGIIQKVKEIFGNVQKIPKTSGFDIPRFKDLHPQYECGEIVNIPVMPRGLAYA